MTFNLYFSGWRGAAKAAAAACIACAFLAACGGGGGGGGGSGASGALTPAMFPNPSQAPAVTGDGAPTAQVPIAAAPSPGSLEAGADAPVPNSRLDCAP
jgi:hypothetical protein